MKAKKKIIFFIPARAGSQRVKKKNMVLIGKNPLLYYKIKSCLASKLGRVIVSTDSKTIANYAKKKGAEVPFMRPKMYSNSKASTIAALIDFVRYLKFKEKKLPDFIALLPPTNPFLKSESIKRAFLKLKNNRNYNSIISYVRANEHPFLYIDLRNKIKFNILKFKGHKYSDFERTQDWPEAYMASSALRISKISFLLKYIKNKNPIFNLKPFDMKKCLGYEISKKESFDINNKRDFKLANFFLKSNF